MPLQKIMVALQYKCRWIKQLVKKNFFLLYSKHVLIKGMKIYVVYMDVWVKKRNKQKKGVKKKK